jgi:hypothetical protein
MKPNVAVLVAAMLVLLAVFWLIYQDVHVDVEPTVKTSVMLPTPTNIALKDHLVDPTGKSIPCFYINLDRSTDRRELFTQRAKAHNLECTRVSGVDGKDPNELEVITRNDFAKTMSTAEVGCTASHLKTIKQAFELGLDYALVFEDDTTFDFVNLWPKNVVTNILADIPDYVGVVQLFWTQYKRKYAKFVVPTHVARGVDSRMASAYIVTKRGMKDILSVADNKDGTFAIVKKYDYQKEGVADKYIYDLTRLCTSGLPLFCVDISKLPSTIEKIAYMDSKHPSYRDVTDAKQVYARTQVVYKHSRPGTAYRLGDTVLGKWDPQTDKAYHLDMYPNSLTALYFSKANRFGNINKLTEATQEFQALHNIQLPTENDVVLHLRLGDVIERSDYSVEQHLIKECPSLENNWYVKPLDYFEKKFESFRLGVRVIIMYGSPFHEYGFSKSKAYVAKVAEFLSNKGFEPVIRSGRDADEDFVFGAFAHNLVTTGGGYSELLDKVNQKLRQKQPQPTFIA